MKLADRLRPHTQLWLDKRIPLSNHFRLSHNRLFIMPTRFGMALLVSCLLLFTLGTNYQNNPVLILCYLLLACFLVSLHYCYLNLNGVTLSLLHIDDAYVGDKFRVQLKLSSQHSHYQWQLYQQHTLLTTFHLVNDNDNLTLQLHANKRGQIRLPRLKLMTTFPLGLFQCWSYLRFDKTHWVYPSSRAGQWQTMSLTAQREPQNSPPNSLHEELKHKLEENFEGIAPYQQGQPMSRVSWKHQAKDPSGDLVVKDFSSNATSRQWLSFTSCSGSSLEQKLSVLVYACLTLEQQNQLYGLKLSGYGGEPVEINQNSGQAHLTQCLQALALYANSEANNDAER